jgi:hypothetical protein
MGIVFSRIQECRREIVMMRCVRILLGFESDGLAISESLAVLAIRLSVKEVSSIELKSRLICPYLHITS